MNTKSKIESLLFISAKPMSVKQLVDIIGGDKKDIVVAGEELISEYSETNKGIQIIKNGSKYQMVSSPDNTELVKKFLKDETTGELSRPSLETLTIIAYKGPISKADLNRIRGVNCSMILRNLLLRGLVETENDSETGEEQYVITIDFLKYLGINDVSQLPDFERLSKSESIDKVLNEDSSE